MVNFINFDATMMVTNVISDPESMQWRGPQIMKFHGSALSNPCDGLGIFLAPCLFSLLFSQLSK